MSVAIRWDLVAWRRTPFGGAIGDGDFVEEGIDWSGATFRMELRDEPGNTATALVTLTNAAAGSQGISASYNAAWEDDAGNVVGATTIRVQIDEATLEALALASDPAQDRVLHYDLHVTPSGQPKRVAWYGTFTLKPGVTI